MKKSILILLLVLGIISVDAQNKENLGSNVNSEFRDINPIVSPDGKTLFFVRVNHPSNKNGKNDSEDIWVSKQMEDESWSVAKPMPATLNRIKYNSILSVTPDGNVLLIKGAFDDG